MHVGREEILKNIEGLDLPDDIREAYGRAFSQAPEKLGIEDVERLMEDMLERHWDPDERVSAYVPVAKLIYGKDAGDASPPGVRTRLLEAVLKNEMPEDNFNIRGKFMDALHDISEGSRTVGRSQVEKAFVIASGNAYPPAQKNFRDGCNHDIGALRSALKQVMPEANLG